MCAKVAGGVCLVGTTRPVCLVSPLVKISHFALNLKCRGRAPILIAIIDRQIFLLTCCLLQGRRQCLGYQLFFQGRRQCLGYQLFITGQGRSVGSVLGTSCLFTGAYTVRRTVGNVLGTSCLLQGRTVGSVLCTSCL
jgi:hypothetical protein